MMLTEPAFYVGIHHHSFRPGKPAEIIGVEFVLPEKELVWRACFKVRYPDGFEDLCPIDDLTAYKLLPKNPEGKYLAR